VIAMEYRLAGWNSMAKLGLPKNKQESLLFMYTLRSNCLARL